MSKILARLGIGLFALVIGCATSLAQSSKGVVLGKITDPTGAVVSGATIKLINKDTGVARESVTAENGTYRIDAVDPGNYRVEVNAAGFKKIAVDDVLVAAGQTTDRPAKLEVGDASEIIEVNSGSAVLLQNQDGARTNTIGERQLQELPRTSFNTSNLVFTLPGVVTPGQGGGFNQGVSFSINGLRPRANNQLIDGMDNNDSSIQGQAARTFMRDAYQEVTVLGGNNSAEYGRGGGAVVNLVTKSGTNQFHGSVYDIITPSKLSALSSGQKTAQQLTKVPVSINNQYGFSIGGPIVKNKLFFFSSLEFTDFRSGAGVVSARVPTAEGIALLRQLFPQGRSANLDAYLNVVGSLRGTGNIQPVQLGGNRPAIPFGVATTTRSQPFDDRQLVARVDWAPTDRDNIAFRYLSQDQFVPNQIASAFDGFGVDVTGRVLNGLITYTHVFSPSLTNEFRVSYGRSDPQFKAQSDLARTLPQFGTADFTNVGLNAAFPQGRTLNNYQYQDTMTWVRGNHTVRFGVDLLRQLGSQAAPINNRGTLNFTAGGGFSAFGNFVDGFSGTQGGFSAITFGDPIVYPKAFQQAYFVNDSWRIKSNLTLNLGLRYENYGSPFNVVRFPAFRGLDQPLNERVEQRRDDNNFAPRFSFAYTPNFGPSWLGDGKTVVRGGYGISYDTFFNNILINNATSAPNALGANLFGAQGGTPRGFANAGLNSLPTSATPSLLTGISTISSDLINPMVHTYNLSVQREVFNNIIVDVAYVGTRGQRLFTNEQANPGVNGTRIAANRGPITVRTNGADSSYNSLQLRVERGLRNGFLVRYAYTYSKGLDNSSEVFVSSGGTSFVSDNFNRRADRGFTSFDATHRNVWSFIYDIPGPKTGWLGQVAGGWSLSGIYRLQTGAVETAFVNGVDLNRDLNGFNDRPAISNPNAPANSVAILGSLLGRPSPYVDALGNPIDPNNARYIVDPSRRTNIVGRNTLRANRTNLFDLSVAKSIKLPFEGHRLELRFDAFNVFNHANFTWGAPNGVSTGDVLSPNFNTIRLNDGGARTGRVTVRYAF